MSNTGIKIDDKVVSLFNELKLNHNNRYLVLGMNDALTLVEVKEVGKRDATYADIYQRLKSDWSSTPCYLVFDYEADTDEGKRQKLLFISWTPNGAKVKQKMVYAGTRADLKSKLPGIQIDLQATDLGDIEESVVASKVK